MDESLFKLGKLAPRLDDRTLQYASYSTGHLNPPPASCDWTKGRMEWGEMANDRLGCCTIASAGHLIESWTANAGTEVTPTDASIVSAYSAVTGYDPSTGLNDNGAAELDVLNYWRKKGIFGHKIGAYAAIDPKNHVHVEEATYLFGGCYIGLTLPVFAQNQDVWSVAPSGLRGKVWGGHAVPVVAYDRNFVTVVTWGKIKKMTWQFFDAYADEAYAVLSPDWFEKNTKAPSGFDLKALQADLKLVA